MAFYRCLNNSKSPRASRTLLNILVDLDNAVVRMVSTHPLIYYSSSHSTNPLVTIPSAPITIGITVIFMFHSLFVFSFSSKVLSLISLFAFVQFYPVVRRNGKVHKSVRSRFFFLHFFFVYD